MKPGVNILAAVAAAGLAALASAPASAVTIIEGFESGSFGAAWVARPGNAPVVSSASAFQGSFGAKGAASAPRWDYRTDPAALIADGSVLSAWARPDSAGRFYLGFGADAGGANSFVLASNTSQLLFQVNEGYGFANVAATPFSFTLGQWYLMTVTFGSDVVGRLYGSDGTTLLAQLTATGLTRGVGGGVAVRSFGVAFDEIGLTTPTAAVPEPATWALLLAGFGLVGFGLRRQRPAAA